jgi:UDP-sulfoquinovose synthase
VLDLAQLVRTAAQNLGMEVEIAHLPDPRVESEEHYYYAKHSKLIDLGLEPHFLCDSLLDSLMNTAVQYADRVDRETLHPKINWRQTRNERQRAAAAAVSI